MEGTSNLLSGMDKDQFVIFSNCFYNQLSVFFCYR